MADIQTVTSLAILGGVGLDVFKTQINNLLSPTTEHMGQYLRDRVQRAFIISENACKKLKKQGVTKTRPMPEKLVAQIMENGSQEGDPTMRELWENLLASAANPNFKQEIPPSFPEILKQLSAAEAAILNKLYGSAIDAISPEAPYPSRAYPVNANFKYTNLNEFATMIDNLDRLNLLTVGMDSSVGGTTFPSAVHFTKLGFAFVSAVWKPGSKPEEMVGQFVPSTHSLAINT
jgi:hypothetical protein